MRRPALILGSLLLTAGIALTGCGSDSSGSATETKVLTVDLANGVADPSGEVVKVSRDQPIQIKVTSDQAGTLHVHSQPEHEFEFKAGTTTLKTFSIPRSGSVEVELHDPALVVYILRVS